MSRSIHPPLPANFVLCGCAEADDLGYYTRRGFNWAKMRRDGFTTEDLLDACLELEPIDDMGEDLPWRAAIRGLNNFRNAGRRDPGRETLAATRDWYFSTANRSRSTTWGGRKS